MGSDDQFSHLFGIFWDRHVNEGRGGRGMLRFKDRLILLSLAFLWNVLVASSFTNPDDYAILVEFRKGLENPELLNWPADDGGNHDPCGSSWRHVFCTDGRVTQIQVQSMGLKGPLPVNFNRLSMLFNLGLQKNNFYGDLPTFKGLSKLKYVYLDYNDFSTIPLDFFEGLTSLQVISLDMNLFNRSAGWVLPKVLEASAQLVNFSCSNCSLVGTIPDFLGGMPSLSSLRLGNNRLTGEIPATFRGSNLKVLRLNNQVGEGLSGSISILATMPSLMEVWLHGNAFTGTIPEDISQCASLTTLLLDNNQLTGVIPSSMATMENLQTLRLSKNKFVGPIPKLHGNLTSDGNSFCQESPGVLCSPQVSDLLDFLCAVSYPLDLAASWSGNNPCASWLGISCSSSRISVINLQNRNLSGIISPSIGKLDSLVYIRLDSNNLSGSIPSNLAGLTSLKLLNLTSNNLSPPVPDFGSGVTLLTDQNPLLKHPSPVTPSPSNSPPENTRGPGGPLPPGSLSSPSPPSSRSSVSKGSGTVKIVTSVSSALLGTSLVALVCLYMYRRNKKKSSVASIFLPPKEVHDPDTVLRVTIADRTAKALTESDLCSSGASSSHVIDTGNLIVSVQVLRNATQGFCSENELGRGGFGVVYKGELDDGTMIAVKRMEAAVISNKACDEFHSEIAVLSKVRHRNLVSLLGYSVEDNERLLVYEYMSQGALSKHLFQWKSLKLEPLSWKKRLNIALDVARGMDYLHNLAHHCFIHRDLKSSNILLGDDYRAKVSDFGLVKLSPDGQNSVATRLAGTFGYLAPEYAVTGKITTKVDVFSFGVVLMELVTGLKALDEDRPEETRYLASWFCNISSNKEMLRAAIDPSLTVAEETFESICTIAVLAGHCAAREPQQRPDMGYTVSILAPLVDKWKPVNDHSEEYLGIDLRLPLLDMVKDWQEADADTSTLSSLGDSNGSIPVAPNGIANSLTYGR